MHGRNQRSKIYQLVIVALWWIVCQVSANNGDIAILDDLEAEAYSKADPQWFVADQLRRSIKFLLWEKLRSRGEKLFFSGMYTNTALVVLLAVVTRLLAKLPVSVIHYLDTNTVAQGHFVVAYFSVLFTISGAVGALFAAGCEVEAATIYGGVFTAFSVSSDLVSHNTNGLSHSGYLYLLMPSLIVGAKIVKAVRAIVRENSKSGRRIAK